MVQAGAAVDLAFMLYGTMSHLLSNDDAAAAFAAAAASLAEGGVFVVEMVHPMDLFSGVLECGDTWEVRMVKVHVDRVQFVEITVSLYPFIWDGAVGMGAVKP